MTGFKAKIGAFAMVRVLLLAQLSLLCLPRAYFVQGLPMTEHLTELSTAFQGQDKICSLNNAAGQGSYRRLISTLTGVNSEWLGRSNKIYTGFKFHRIYHFGSMFSKVKPAIQMSFCKEGKLQWQSELPYDKEINWNTPICLYAEPLTSTVAAEHRKSWNILKSSKGGTISDARPEHQDPEHLHCFKLARRQKYVQRNVSVYLPHKWIGGLYYCNLDIDTKSELLTRLNDGVSSNDYSAHSICGPDIAVPLQPVISDSYHKHSTVLRHKSRFPYLRRLTRTRMDKVVPFLHTPNDPAANGIMNNELSTQSNQTAEILPQSIFQQWWPFTSALRSGNWFADIDVNESYNAENFPYDKVRARADKTVHQVEQLLDRISLRGRDYDEHYESLHKLKRPHNIDVNSSSLAPHLQSSSPAWAQLGLSDKAINLVTLRLLDYKMIEAWTGNKTEQSETLDL